MNALKQAQNKLFTKLKSQGVFWSYAETATLDTIDTQTLIEHILKYADFDDIIELFRLYQPKVIQEVWEKTMKNDLRFKKLNLLLAQLFFGLKVEADYFTGGESERAKELRMLAS